jgi:hypothetical protein
MAVPYRNALGQMQKALYREDCTPYLTDFLGRAVVFLKPNASAELREKRASVLPVSSSALLGSGPGKNSA